MTQKPTITQTLRNWIQAWLVGVALLILVAIDAFRKAYNNFRKPR